MDFSSISASYEHACGLTTAGKAYCWGRGTSGRLGNNDASNAESKIPVGVIDTDYKL